jgi:uncharacterized sulfatase
MFKRPSITVRVMNYKGVLLALVLLPVGVIAGPRPNFLFVLIDDMGYADLSCYGQKAIETPNIDRMAKEGIRFTQFYVNSPICSPSRTALMTGQFPARWGITSYLASRAENKTRGIANWLDPKAPTVARLLHDAGYATGHFGKWHMGGQRDVGEAPLITEYGFDKSVTQFEGLGERILPLCDNFDGKGAKQYALGSDKLGRGEITWMDRSKVTSGFVERALQFIRQSEHEGKPFYVDVWPDDVHSPFFPPKALRGDQTKKQLYLGVVRAMDEQLAPLFEFIRQHPSLRTNTLIVIASDNGPEPGAGSAGVFRGHKGILYEGGVREPFITWGPGLLAEKARGTVNEKTVIAGIDLLPSLIELAGLHLGDKKLDGEDLSASMLGKALQTRTNPLFWIRPPDRPGDNRERWPDLSVRDGDFKLLLMEDGSSAQLYDLATDPSEKLNLTSQKPEAVQRLTKELFDWRKSLPIEPMAK